MFTLFASMFQNINDLPNWFVAMGMVMDFVIVMVLFNSRIMEMTHQCEKCKDEGWVCIQHPDQDWETCQLCSVKEGVPCKACNPCDEKNSPRLQPGFKTVNDKDGWRH